MAIDGIERGIVKHHGDDDIAGLGEPGAGLIEADLDTLISETAVGVAAEQVESLTQQGFVFDSRILTGLASTLRAEGYETSAARFEILADIPRVGPCAEPRP